MRKLKKLKWNKYLFYYILLQIFSVMLTVVSYLSYFLFDRITAVITVLCVVDSIFLVLNLFILVNSSFDSTSTEKRAETNTQEENGNNPEQILSLKDYFKINTVTVTCTVVGIVVYYCMFMMVACLALVFIDVRHIGKYIVEILYCAVFTGASIVPFICITYLIAKGMH